MRTSITGRILAALLLVFLLGLFAACDDGGEGNNDGDTNPSDGDKGSDGDTQPDGDATDGDLPPDGDTQPESVIRVVPSPLSFGNVSTRDTPEMAFTVYNDGFLILHLQDATWTSVTPSGTDIFVLKDYLAASIQPLDNRTFHVKFTPKDTGEYSAKLLIHNDSSNQPNYELDVTASVVPPEGEAKPGSNMTKVDFGQVKLGTVIPQVKVNIGNTGDGLDKLYLTRVYLQGEGTGIFKVKPTDSGVDFDEDNPLELSSKQSISFSVNFAPASVSLYTDTLVAEYYTDKDTTVKTYELPVTGEAIAGAILCIPLVLDYGSLPLGMEKPLEVKLRNNTPDMVINLTTIRIEGLSNWQANFTFSDGGAAPTTLDPAEDHVFTLTFKPTSVKLYDAKLTVNTDNSGSYSFDILAEGGAANKAPIAKAGTSPHGSDINAIIETSVGGTVQLYADISYDPEGQNESLTYEWTMSKPNLSTANFIPNAASMNVAFQADVAGNYLISLVVEDEIGARSTPKIIEIHSQSGYSTIRVEMRTTGLSGASDADLAWVHPRGICDEGTATGGTCLVPSGYGSIQMKGCGSAGVCTTEEITHANAPDGNYEIRVTFEEDCPDSIYKCPLDIGKQSLSFDLFIYTDGQLKYQITGETIENAQDPPSVWSIAKQSGTWQAPVRQ